METNIVKPLEEYIFLLGTYKIESKSKVASNLIAINMIQELNKK